MDADILINVFVMGKDYLVNDLLFLLLGSRKIMPNARVQGRNWAAWSHLVIHVFSVCAQKLFWIRPNAYRGRKLMEYSKQIAPWLTGLRSLKELWGCVQQHSCHAMCDPAWCSGQLHFVLGQGMGPDFILLCKPVLASEMKSGVSVLCCGSMRCCREQCSSSSVRQDGAISVLCCAACLPKRLRKNKLGITTLNDTGFIT